MRRGDMPLGEIEEVKMLIGEEITNSKLEEGWILLDARVIQLSPESRQEKAMDYYIIGRKGKIK